MIGMILKNLIRPIHSLILEAPVPLGVLYFFLPNLYIAIFFYRMTEDGDKIIRTPDTLLLKLSAEEVHYRSKYLPGKLSYDIIQYFVKGQLNCFIGLSRLFNLGLYKLA